MPDIRETGASAPEPFDLYSTEIDADPFPAYARLRDQHPCYWSERGQLWILTRYDDVARAAQDWATFSSQSGNLIDEIPGRAGGTLGTTDPPRHDRLRKLAQAAFMRKNLDYLPQFVSDVAERALDEIAGRENFDFVAEFSSVITVATLCQVLGLPQQEPAGMRNKVLLSVSTNKKTCLREPEHDHAFRELADFVTREVEARRADPQDDLITQLAEAEIDGDRLSDREVIMTTASFAIAGIESLSSFMSMLALNLCDYPEARARVVADPALLPQAIEESLRFNTSAQRFKRVIKTETELHGQKLHKGDKVALAYGAANRDERKFPDAESYDIDRNPQQHLGFGAGKHFCIGSQFARLVTETAMARFLERVPEYRLEARDFGWLPSSNFRSPMTLPFIRH